MDAARRAFMIIMFFGVVFCVGVGGFGWCRLLGAQRLPNGASSPATSILPLPRGKQRRGAPLAKIPSIESKRAIRRWITTMNYIKRNHSIIA